MNHVNIGIGPAGVVAAEALRKRAPGDAVTMIGDEPEPSYSRMAIPYLLMGNIDETGTYLRKDANHFAKLGIELKGGHVSAVDTGKREGAELICGGNRLTKGNLAAGNFVAPTVFVKTKPSMKVVREEIFGPVLVVQLFETEEEALRLANDTIYGLAGAVFTGDGGKGLRVLKKLRAGITWLNTYHPTFNEAPWGGYKQSGIGRELGTFGLDAYMEVKQININLVPQRLHWFSGLK